MTYIACTSTAAEECVMIWKSDVSDTTEEEEEAEEEEEK